MLGDHFRPSVGMVSTSTGYALSVRSSASIPWFIALNVFASMHKPYVSAIVYKGRSRRPLTRIFPGEVILTSYSHFPRPLLPLNCLSTFNNVTNIVLLLFLYHLLGGRLQPNLTFGTIRGRKILSFGGTYLDHVAAAKSSSISNTWELNSLVS